MFAIAACLSAQAQQSDFIFNKFKNAKAAEYVVVDQSMLNACQGKGLNVMEGKIQLGGDIPKNISSIKVLDLGKCKKKVQKGVFSCANSLQGQGYETLVSATEEGDNIVEILIYRFDKEDNDCALVQLCGSIKKQDLEEIMQGCH